MINKKKKMIDNELINEPLHNILNFYKLFKLCNLLFFVRR